eukprot:TRINITY_DN15778_c0_g1_i1.p1 TRINITY_DN15778_c0_g1~~TRINITY_DN15778_c0_g1_i1.p1  ORF type:complete len:520 (+),score=42.65 TRINITY_DN15778_c0_g1_i1:79-1638(+)
MWLNNKYILLVLSLCLCLFCRIEGQSCGNFTYTDATGSFDDGSGSSDYVDDFDCNWYIDLSNLDVSTIVISFSSFYTELSADYLHIYYMDASTSTWLLHSDLSGSRLFPFSVQVFSDQLLINFVTDSSITHEGWTLTYQSYSEHVYSSYISTNVVKIPQIQPNILISGTCEDVLEGIISGPSVYWGALSFVVGEPQYLMVELTDSDISDAVFTVYCDNFSPYNTTTYITGYNNDPASGSGNKPQFLADSQIMLQPNRQYILICRGLYEDEFGLFTVRFYSNNITVTEYQPPPILPPTVPINPTAAFPSIPDLPPPRLLVANHIRKEFTFVLMNSRRTYDVIEILFDQTVYVEFQCQTNYPVELLPLCLPFINVTCYDLVYSDSYALGFEPITKNLSQNQYHWYEFEIQNYESCGQIVVSIFSNYGDPDAALFINLDSSRIPIMIEEALSWGLVGEGFTICCDDIRLSYPNEWKGRVHVQVHGFSDTSYTIKVIESGKRLPISHFPWLGLETLLSCTLTL